MEQLTPCNLSQISLKDAIVIFLKFFAIFTLGFLLSWTTDVQAKQGLSLSIKSSEHPDASTIGEVALYSDYQALVIGIDKYINGWPVLSNAIRDADKVAKSLTDRGFQVTRLNNPTSNQLKASLEQFYITQGSSTQAGLFLWFAGHGHTKDGEGYLVPSDAPPPSNSSQFKYKALSLRRFGEYVRLANAKHSLAVFDSCFSGTIFNTQRSFPPSAITLSTTYPVRQFISSGDANQAVSDDGTFAKLFIDTLNGKTKADANQDGYLTGTELGLFLSDRLTNLTQSLQTPRYGKIRDPRYDLGDFVFELPERSYSQEIPTPEKKATKPQEQYNIEIIFWNAIKNSVSPIEFQAYLEEYPNGIFKKIANLKLQSFQKKTTAKPTNTDTTLKQGKVSVKPRRPPPSQNQSKDNPPTKYPPPTETAETIETVATLPQSHNQPTRVSPQRITATAVKIYTPPQSYRTLQYDSQPPIVPPKKIIAITETIEKPETATHTPSFYEVTSLRSTSNRTFGESSLRNALIEFNLFEKNKNPTGDFKNNFEVISETVIKDRSTSLMWQRAGSTKRSSFDRAKKYITGLNKNKFSGCSNWRLPTIVELASLLQKKNQNNMYISNHFSSKQKYCWSTDRTDSINSEPDEIAVWVTNFSTGTIVKANWFDRLVVDAYSSSYISQEENYVRAVCSQ